MPHIEPNSTDEALLADIEAVNPGDGIVLWWLGQGAFLVKSAAGRVLFDPHLAFSRSYPHADADQLHFRQARPVAAPGRLTSIDVVTSSHHHADHLDAETFTSVFNANPKSAFVVPETNRKFMAEQLGCDPAWPWGLSDGESVSIGEITILAVPTAHDEINQDELGRHCRLGYVVWLGNMKVYHSGETPPPETVDLLRPLAVDVALLPINGNRPKRRVVGDRSGEKAAQLAHDISAGLVVPYHYEVSDFNTASPALFEASCRRLGQTHKTLQFRERLHIAPK